MATRVKAPNGSALGEATSISGVQRTIQPSKPQRASTKYKHTFAVHAENRTSCLSSDSTEPPSFFGFRNLMGLVLVVSNLRLMIENFKKYGVLVTLSGSQIRKGDWTWFGTLYLLTPCFLFIAYAIEALAAQYAKGKVAERKRHEEREDKQQMEQSRRHIFSTWRVIAFCHGFNATLMLAIATWAVYYQIHNPGTSMLAYSWGQRLWRSWQRHPASQTACC